MSHTVIGIFNDKSEAEKAARELIDSGFTNEKIDISSPENASLNSSLGGFFKSLFNDSNDAELYKESSRTRTLVTVHAQSTLEAQNAAQVLDRNGALDVNNSSSGFNSSNNEITGYASPDDDATSVVGEPFKLENRDLQNDDTSFRGRVFESRVEDQHRLREDSLFGESNENSTSGSDFAPFKKDVELTDYTTIPVANSQPQHSDKFSLNNDYTDRNEPLVDTGYNTEVDVDRYNTSRDINVGENIVATNDRIEQRIFASDDKGGDFLDKTTEKELLRRMRELEDDFKVAERDTDVRGWNVVTSNDRIIGEVDELIVDTTAMKVRYLDVEVTDGLISNEDKHILIPIGSAILDRENHNIVVNSINPETLANYPAYNGESISRSYEDKLMSAVSPGYQSGSKEDFYAGDQFDIDRFSGSKNS